MRVSNCNHCRIFLWVCKQLLIK